MSKISNLVRRRSAAVIALMTFGLLILAFVVLTTKIILITDGSTTTMVHSLRSDARSIIGEAGINLGEYDSYDAQITGHLGKIKIERAFPVTLKCDGEEKAVMTTDSSIEEFLKTNQITLGEFDYVNYSLYDRIAQDMNIVVSRVRYEVVNEKTTVPYETTKLSSKSIPRGRYKVKVPGVEGVAYTLKQNVYVDGKLTDANILEQQVIKNPSNEVVEYGAGGEQTTSRGESFRYSYYFDARATGYTCGEAGVNNITATGKQVQVGYVAVDPRVIPLHTRLYIEYPNGKWSYGFAVAEDVGGSIKGKRVDLYFNSLKDANNFGVRTVRVYVLE